MTDEMLDTIIHDLAYYANDNHVVTGALQVVQNVKIRLLFLKGEWYRDTRMGVPYFEQAFAKGDHAVVDSFLKATILETPEVRNLLSFSTSFDSINRKYTVTFSIDTVYGATEDTLTIGT